MKDGKSSEEQKNREGCAGIDADVLRESILREGRQAPELHVCGCTGSTNSDALTLGRSNAREAFFVAARQNSGRGRIGRSFFSPEGGLYMSVLTPASGENFLRGDPDWAGFITCSAGIALSGAVRAVFGIRTGLKWVNDLIYKGAKAGGILTEGLFSGGIPVCTVTGAGVNLWPPAPGFPPGLSGNISTLLDAPSPMAREQLAAVKDMRQNGFSPLGNWHSHPASPSRPSEEDKRLAYDSRASYLILSLLDQGDPVLNSFHIEDGQSEKESLCVFPSYS